MRLPMLFRFRALFLGLVCLCCMGLILTYYQGKDVKLCFRKPENVPGLLEDVLDAAIQPTVGGSIFFHETSCRMMQESRFESIFSLGKQTHINVANLNAREACAVESAALHNPNLTVFVLFVSPAFWFNDSSNDVMNAVLSYPNVHIRNLNLWRYATDTPIYEWLKTDKLFKSSYVLSHTSDFLRFLTLWRYGGTYLDLDVVVLRNLEELPPNYTGAESDTSLAAGVMNFAPTGIGRKVADYCLQDFEKNFSGRDWGNNGPGVITRTLKYICQAQSVSEMFDIDRCIGFKVYQRDAFYAIPWREWEHFFDENLAQSTMKRISQSYVAHVWNKHSTKRKHRVGTPGAYGELAAKNCPKPIHKYKLTANEGARIRRIHFASFSCRVPPELIASANASGHSPTKSTRSHDAEANTSVASGGGDVPDARLYHEMAMICLTNLGDIMVLSVPELKRQLNAAAVRHEDINGISSLCFTNSGEALYMMSSSEVQRISLATSKIVTPMGSIAVEELAIEEPVEMHNGYADANSVSEAAEAVNVAASREAPTPKER